MDFLGLNFWSILVAAIAYMLFGVIWYSSAGFGASLEKLAGKIKKRKKDSTDTMILAFIGALVTSYVIALMMATTAIVDIWEAFLLVDVLWLGLVVPIQLAPVIWEDKPWQLFVLNSAYYLLGLYVIGGVLALL